MNTNTTTPPTPAGLADQTPGFTDTLASEWHKLRSLRLYPVLIAAIVCLSVGVGAFLALISGESVAAAQAESEYSVIFYSKALTTWVFAGLAAHFVGRELTGPGQATFTATARRLRVLLAKLVLIILAGLLTGIVSSIATAAATQGVLATQGYPPLDLTEPGLVRALLILVGGSMVVQALIATALTVLTKSAIWGAVGTALLSLLPVSLATLLGPWYAEHIPRLVPGAAVESLAGVAAPEGYGYLPVPVALTAVGVWLFALLGAGCLRLPRMDIG